MSSGIGDLLRGARHSKGVTLTDAARQTGVRETHLAALERDELEAIGIDPVYVRGILRAYAEYLDLDAAGLLARYRSAAEPQRSRRRRARAPSGPPPRRAHRLAATLVGALLLFVVFVGATVAVLTLRGDDGDPDPAASAGELATTPTVAASPTASERESEQVVLDIPQGSAPKGLTMKLEFTDKVWVRVLVDGHNKLEGIMRPGAVTQFSGDRRIELRLGVADAVQFSLNGAWYGEVASDLDGPVNVTCTTRSSCKVTEVG